MPVYTQKKIYITWMPSLLDFEVWGTGTVSLNEVGLALTMGGMRTGDGHARRRRLIGYHHAEIRDSRNCLQVANAKVQSH